MSTLTEKLEALAGCPCGRAAKIQKNGRVYWARCVDALCWYGPERPTPSEAAEAWNSKMLLSRALLADHAKEEERGLRWYPWVCINGHSNDHAKLAPDGTKMCSTPGCQAEAEAHHAPATPDGLREEIRWFAGEMEHQLRENDGKRGWQDCGRTWLAGQARTNLSEVLRLDFSEKDAIVKAAADAANFCMMIADNRTWPRAALAPRKE